MYLIQVHGKNGLNYYGKFVEQ